MQFKPMVLVRQEKPVAQQIVPVPVKEMSLADKIKEEFRLKIQARAPLPPKKPSNEVAIAEKMRQSIQQQQQKDVDAAISPDENAPPSLDKVSEALVDASGEGKPKKKRRNKSKKKKKNKKSESQDEN
jgi:hypothetical protein